MSGSIARPLVGLLALLALTVPAGAVAQDARFGATLAYGGQDAHPLAVGVDASLTLDAASLDPSLPEGAALGVRVDASAPTGAPAYPALAVGGVWRQAVAGLVAYGGLGADVRGFDVDGVRCYETAARLTAGLEVPVADAVALRAEAVALSSGRLSAGLGVTFALP
ncbi:MAG: hypothetical protein RI554_10650 [Trueperaceae bacterium]|nr:hypothetical protein [Trueperaceae bacterium]